jgi:class 3 adenylate cyclase
VGGRKKRPSPFERPAGDYLTWDEWQAECALLGATPTGSLWQQLAAAVDRLTDLADAYPQVQALPEGDLAILLTDLSDFTEYLYAYGVEKTIARLHVQALAIFDRSLTHQGSLVNCTGDGFIFVFGSADESLSAALQIRDLLREWNESLPEAERLSTKFLLHFGPLRRVGFGLTTTLVGLPLNFAARMEKKIQGGTILVSKTFRQQVTLPGVTFVLEPWEGEDVHGFAEPEAVYRLTSMRG